MDGCLAGCSLDRDNNRVTAWQTKINIRLALVDDVKFEAASCPSRRDWAGTRSELKQNVKLCLWVRRGQAVHDR
ncbi:hypothetical protein PoB_007456700 [Plakobranchus ocellatus]|uniref:Uncharacterized protein n=1 Tax=Plakobranchus ocellatus TaxID=259542 RepID=A0AAV4DUU0_9GAST|nr:hypothetical protein PoB_007456700 [Plakobranchus ocellatus]